MVCLPWNILLWILQMWPKTWYLYREDLGDCVPGLDVITVSCVLYNIFSFIREDTQPAAHLTDTASSKFKKRFTAFLCLEITLLPTVPLNRWSGKMLPRFCCSFGKFLFPSVIMKKEAIHFLLSKPLVMWLSNKCLKLSNCKQCQVLPSTNYAVKPNLYGLYIS